MEGATVGDDTANFSSEEELLSAGYALPRSGRDEKS